MTFIFRRSRMLASPEMIGLAVLGVLVGSCTPGTPLAGGLEPPPDDVLSVQLFPDSVVLNPVDFVDFTAIAELNGGGSGKVQVAWEAAGGTITADGRYTAGGTAGSYKVIGRYRNGKADSSIVVINAPPPGPVLTRISVTPVTAALLPGATQQFSAIGVLSDGSNSSVAVTWTATSGSVDAGALYTAPTTTGNYLVVATQQGGTLSDTAQVSVAVPPPSLTAVILTPASASLQFGQTQQFSAVGQLSDGSSTSIAITWTATGGTVGASGLYTAGGAAGNFRVIARSATGLADTSTVAVTAPTVTAISLTPATASLQSGQTQQFSASATLSNGGTQANAPVTWTATGGAINASGLYTAGATAGTFRVVAASAGGPADTSAVTVATPTITSITVTPATVSLSSGATQQFNASATLSNGATQLNPAVTWTATGGPISSGGLYTAGSTTGSFRVIGASANGKADTSAVTVTASAPTITTVVVAPATANLVGGQAQQFTASATLSDGTTLTNPAVTWSGTGGSVSTGGLYTAGNSGGSFRVIAISSNGIADTSLVTVTSSGAGQPGNLFSWSFEDGTFGGMTNGGGGTPDYSIVSSGGSNGARYAEATIPASSSDGAANMYWDGGTPHKDLWVVVAIKVTTKPSTGLATQKMVIFREAGFNAQIGEMNQIGDFYIWNWLDGGFNLDITTAGTINSTLGQWNVWKIHFNNTGAHTVITFGLNGVDNIWTNTRPGTQLINPQIIDFGGVLNGGSGPSQFGFDYVQIGTVDPGWP